MNQLLLEKNLETKFTPLAAQRNNDYELYQQPSLLAKILAEKTIEKLDLNIAK